MKVVLLVVYSSLFCFTSIAAASSLFVESRDALIHDSFEVSIHCDATVPVRGFECILHFDKNLLRANDIEEAGYFDPYDIFTSPHMGIIDNDNGTIRNIYEFILGNGNVSGSRVLFTVNFTLLRSGIALVSLENVGLANQTNYVPVDVRNGTVTANGFWYAPENEEDPPQTNPLDDSLSVLLMTVVAVLIVIFLLIIMFSNM